MTTTAPPETTPGRALRPKEALSSDLPLVLVRGSDHGKEIVLPGYYACVGTMPCADTEYYLLVRWEHREGGRQGERRVVLAEQICVLDPALVLLPPPYATSVTLVASSGPAGAAPEDMGHQNNERYPQLRHSSKRKS